MSLAPGTRLGAYEVLALLGAGGMGEVYQARDTRLKRDVALKVLPDTFAQDADRLARFQREAELLATLNHPNIAGIYGVEDSDRVRTLVLELVEGPTLADRIAKGPIPIDDALPIARQITNALEAAHEKGVIHRDLKPANIKVTPDGKVKVLDFGLAKAFEPISGGHSDATAAPTITTPAMTGMGVILGTAAYMSPEQAKGRPADKRSDIWAFGCVFYEVLTGTRAFPGDDVSETLPAVIKSEPDWRALPAATPPSIHRLLRRCLAKERSRRLPDIAVARLEIDDAGLESVIDTGKTQHVVPRTERLAWASAIAFLVAAAAAGILWARRAAPQPPEVRLEITTPPTSDPISLAISPDGQKIVFVATDEARPRLWVRALDAGSARPLEGSEGAASPFWSPDDQSLGFFADGRLKTLNIAGRSVRTLARVGGSNGGAWNRDDVILFAASGVGPLSRVAATGGTPTAVTQLQPEQRSHSFPQFLPDERHFLYYAAGTPEVRGVYVGRLDGSDTKRITDADAAAVFGPSDRLLFVRQGTLLAQRFDPDRLELSGMPVTLAEHVAFGADSRWGAALSASPAGVVAYRLAGIVASPRYMWFDRSGKKLEDVGDPIPGGTPALSPDLRRLAFNREVDGNTDIWVLDIPRGISNRFTVDPALDSHPLWSADGGDIIFQRLRPSGGDLYKKAISGSGDGELLLANAYGKIPTDASRDGRFVLYKENSGQNGSWNIWALPLTETESRFR